MIEFYLFDFDSVMKKTEDPRVNFGKLFVHYEKICYDNPGNVPNKGNNFNTQKFGENVFICYLYD